MPHIIIDYYEFTLFGGDDVLNWVDFPLIFCSSIIALPVVLT